MKGSKFAAALTISMMVVMVFASFGATIAQDVGAPAPAPVSGAATIYVPAVLAAMASLFAWLF